MRGFAVGLLAVIGLALLPMADLATWVDRRLLDTGRFTSTASEVLDESDVRVALAQEVSQRLGDEFPQVRGREADVQRAAALVAKSDAFRLVFDEAIGRTHEQLVNGDDRLTIDLDAMIPLIQERLPSDVAAEIDGPSGLADVEVVTRDDAPLLWRGIDLADKAATVLPLLCVLCLATAIVLARRRAVTAVVIGGLGAAMMLGAVLLLQLGTSVLESFTVDDPVQDRAVDAGSDVVFATLVRQSVVIGVAFLVVAGIGVFFALSSRRGERPAEWA